MKSVNDDDVAHVAALASPTPDGSPGAGLKGSAEPRDGAGSVIRSGVRLALCARDSALYISAEGSDPDLAVAYFLRFLETLSREYRADPRFVCNIGAPAHDNLLRFLQYVGHVADGSIKLRAASDLTQPFIAKCGEYFSYLAAKCSEHGITEVSRWQDGIGISDHGAEAERVLLVVVQETVDHLFDFYVESRVRPAAAHAPVQFVESADDSRKSRGYFYAGNETAIVETHFDCHLYVGLRNLAIMPTVLKTGWWEPWNDILLRSLLAPGMSFANAGANIGYHTVLGAKLVEHMGRVFAFEPNPETYALLRKTVHFNGFLERTSLYRAAVTDSAADGSTYYMAGSGGGGRLLAALEKPAEPKDMAHATKVASVTLDGTVGAKLDTLDVLLMDIEGSEGAAILGGRDLIRRSRGLRLILEWSAIAAREEVRRQFEEAARFLDEEKFRFYRIIPPSGNVYATPPLLSRVEAQDLLQLPHCDLFLSRA
jgi:FkbM family methyltransferase